MTNSFIVQRVAVDDTRGEKFGLRKRFEIMQIVDDHTVVIATCEYEKNADMIVKALNGERP